MTSIKQITIEEKLRLRDEIYKAVLRDSMGKSGSDKILLQLSGDLASFKGNVWGLREFLLRMGTYNIYKALSEMEILDHLFRTDDEKKKEMVLGNIPNHGRSLSGHLLRNEFILIGRKGDPRALLPTGIDGILSIVEGFGKPEDIEIFRPEHQAAALKRKEYVSHKALAELKPTLDSLLQGEKREHTRTILGLTAENEHLVAMLDRLLYGNTALMDKECKNTFLLTADRKGQLHSFYRAHMTTLPTEIRDRYTRWNSSIMRAGDERQSMDDLAILTAFMMMNTHLSAEAALGSYIEDLNIILNDESFMKRYAGNREPNLAGIRDILMKPEVTYLEAARVFLHYPVFEARISANKDYLSRGKLGEDLAMMIEKFEPIFKEGDHIRRDLLKNIALQRMKEQHPELANVGKTDLEAVRELLLIRSISNSASDPDNGMFKSFSMNRFRTLVDRIAIANRKMALPEKFFRETKMRPGYEIYGLAEDLEQEHGITGQELLNRIKSLLPYETFRRKQMYAELKQLKTELEAGLYLSSSRLEGQLAKGEAINEETRTRAKTLVSHMKWLKELESYEKIAETYGAADHLMCTGLIPSPQCQGIILPKKKEYFTHKERETIERIANIRKRIGEMMDEPRLEALIKRRSELAGAYIISGDITDIKRQEYPDTEPKIMLDTVRVIDVNGLEKHIAELETDFVYSSNLKDDWVSRMRFLLSQDAINAVGFLIKKNINRSISFITGPAYVSKALVAEADEAYALAKEYLKNTPLIASGRKELLSKGEIFGDEKYRVVLRNQEYLENQRVKELFITYEFSDRTQITFDRIRKEWYFKQPMTAGKLLQNLHKIELYNKERNKNLSISIIPPLKF